MRGTEAFFDFCTVVTRVSQKGGLVAEKEEG